MRYSLTTSILSAKWDASSCSKERNYKNRNTMLNNAYGGEEPMQKR